MTDFLQQKRDEIAGRLKELQPLVREYERLQAATAALDGVSAAPMRRVPATAGSLTRSRAATGAAEKGARRGRPKGSGKRAEQALAAVKATPGITIPELARVLDTHPNYLYRVLPNLAAQRLVIKTGRGWHPVETA